MIYPKGITTSYGYDNLNRLIAVETRNLTNDLLASYAYTLNSKGQRTRIVEGAGGPATRTIDYSYDAADRLTEERITDPVLGNRTISYTYDPVGNRLTKTENGVTMNYTYDDNDRLLNETPLLGGAGGGLTYTYDNNGNMLTKTGNGETWQLTYNVLNQLVQANINATTVAYQYDHDGLRVRKTVNGANVTNYLVDKNVPYAQVLEEQWTRGAQSGVTRYTYGDALIAQTTGGVSQFYQYDGLGSTRSLTDASGAMTDAYTYDAYGLLAAQSGTTANSYLYRGEQYDPETDAYYLRARYYQPGIGRFLTTDPEEGFTTNPLSRHRYVYGGSNPVNYIDPSGKTNIMDMLATKVILGNLVATGVGIGLEQWCGFYSKLGEWLFPDAYILGISGFVSFQLLDEILGYAQLLNYPTRYYTMSGMAGIGGELLLNISSGQLAFYGVPTVGIPSGTWQYDGWHGPTRIRDRFSWGFGIYQGYVWNLWNADDYTKHFVTFGVSGDTSGVGVFFDPTSAIAGPWGIARTLLGKTYGKTASLLKGQSFRLYSYSYYHMLYHRNFQNEWQVGSLAAMFSIAGNLLEAKFNPTSTYWRFFVYADPTIWAQSTISKYYWNKKSGYNVDFRQNNPRPENFQSGPGLAVFSLFGG